MYEMERKFFHMIKWFIFTVVILFSSVQLHAEDKVLIVFEGKDSPGNMAKGVGLELYQLLGHFTLEKDIVGSDEYISGKMEKYSFVFFVGFTKNCEPSSPFLDDAYKYKGRLIWLNTGIIAYNTRYPLRDKYGFEPLFFDSQSGVNSVIALDKKVKFTKSYSNLTVIKILDKSRVEVFAEAESPNNKSLPYAIRSGNFYYFADSPLAYTTETDRYIFFAEKLHEILNQPHDESHYALIRIEDVHPLEDPSNIRKITDLLYSKSVPFLVSVVPFYVNPSRNVRVGLSDKPDMVEALRYAQSHGGTIVMHGVTHQYRGETTIDFEFWDEVHDRPIENDNASNVEKKIESGIMEMMRNGLFPVVWETPHYTASTIDYAQIGKIFSTAVEGSRLVINNRNYGQFFPYIIYKDMYGQKIYPENLGYVPLGKPEEMEQAVQKLLKAARVNLYVRDGFATAFFHSFLPLNLLKELVEGIKNLGYTYVDIKNDNHFIKLADRTILTGKGSVTINIDDQYLKEVYINKLGKTIKTEISGQRMKGKIIRSISLEPGWIYIAEPIGIREHKQTLFDKLTANVRKLWDKITLQKDYITPAIAAILWNPSATGTDMVNQLSFHTALRSVGIPVDRIPITTLSSLSKYNLLIVPCSSAEILPDLLYERVKKFVKDGGYLITDSKNPLASHLGVKFGKSVLDMKRVRDALFPEELLNWGTSEAVYSIIADQSDKIICTDDMNRHPVGIARKHGKGMFIVINSQFDPVTGGGYARFPYLVEWLKTYFHIYPILRRDFIEVYFDPGLRKGLSIESLVKQWSELGIRVVHAAGWHEYPKYTYDYDRLIRLCHAYGIVVYAWLEPPQISKKFYDEHPEWREKNYEGEDVRYDWRYPVALTDANCLSTATEWMRTFLSSHDWDGVNIAEIYFGGIDAPEDHQYLTPFHPSGRKMFKHQFGFDPVQLFQRVSSHYYKTSPKDWHKFIEFRVGLVTQLTEEFLKVASDVFNHKPGTQIILTILDQKTQPDLRRKIGIDVDQILLLRKKVKFAIQVEDPEAYWNKDPRRYLEIGEQYKKLLGSEAANLLIDLNILSFRKDYTGNFPTLTPSGIESYLLVNSAASTATRMTIYSEATIQPQDLANFPFALAAPISHIEMTSDGYRVKADYPITLYLGENIKRISLDGRSIYPYRKGYFRIPAGEHTVSIKKEGFYVFENDTVRSHLVAASCSILSEHISQRGVEFTYDSPMRCAVSFDKLPDAVFIDGQKMSFNFEKEEHNYGVLLPSGVHKVDVVLQSTVSRGIELTSFWSSVFIAIFGLLAGGILISLYITTKVK
jgi:uncharacterized protein YdaL